MAAEVIIRFRAEKRPGEMPHGMVYDVVLCNGHDHVLDTFKVFKHARFAQDTCQALMDYLDAQDVPPSDELLGVLRNAFQVADQAARQAGDFDQLDEPTDREELAYAHGTAEGLRMAVEMLTPVYGGAS